jgi:predicted transcriptional regulator
MHRPLGQLQHEVLRVLWNRREATVGEIQQALPDRAYTTLATVLTRLERAGVVERRMDGRTAVYSALLSENQAGHSLLRDLLDRFFSGSHAKLVNHLLNETDVDPDELDRIRTLIAERAGRPTESKSAESKTTSRGKRGKRS